MVTRDVTPVSRRQALVYLGGLAASLPMTLDRALAARVPEDHPLTPGDFTWNPERAPSGPVAIIVSIPDQRVTVYRSGSVIAVSTCSTGKPGHSTPTGTFTILEKAKTHFSSTYNNAPMPNMERLTWSGIALHAGKLPGYPASHGCVRLPMDFSALLFTVTHVGTTVVITNDHVSPPAVQHDGMVLADYDPSENAGVEAALQGKTATSMRDKFGATPIPRPNPTPTASVASPAAPAPINDPLLAVIVSSVDKKIVVLDHDQPVAEGIATIVDPDKPLGSHVFVLAGSDGSGLTWHVVSFSAEPGDVVSAADADVLRRIKGDTKVIDAMKERMHPGMVLVTTDEPIGPETRTAAGFTIMDNDPA